MILRALLEYDRGSDKKAYELCVRAMRAGSWEAYCVLG